jgi:acetyl esterase/lipase
VLLLTSFITGGLILLAMLHIRDQTSLPQPRCAIAHSPWTDVSSALTSIKGLPLYQTDYLFNYDKFSGQMNDLVRPKGEPFDTPSISPVLVKDLSRLPPQLVFWGDAEVLRTDSTRWIARSRDAGNRVAEYVGRGQMHTFSDGPQVGGSRVADECDDVVINYVITELAAPV